MEPVIAHQVPPCVIVYGPPCAGKTTWVRQHARRNDLVVDHDLIAQRLGSPSTHHHPRELRAQAEHHVRRLLLEIEHGQHDRWWVVRTLANPADRAPLAARLAGRAHLILPPRSVLYARADQRPRPRQTRYVIDQWLAHHRADLAARVTRPHPSPPDSSAPRTWAL